MKKFFINMIALISIFILSACSINQKSDENSEEEVEKTETVEDNSSTTKKDSEKSKKQDEDDKDKEKTTKQDDGKSDEKSDKHNKDKSIEKEDKKSNKRDKDESKSKQEKSNDNSNKITKEPRLIENERGGTDYRWPHDLTDISNLTFGKNMNEEIATDACSLIQYYNDSLIRLYNGDITAITFFVDDDLFENTLLPNYYSGDFRNQEATVECLKADYYPETDEIYLVADRTFSHDSGSGTVTMEYIINREIMEVIDFNEIEVK